MTVRDLHPDTAVLLRRVFYDQDLSWPETDGVSEEVFIREVTAQGMAPLLFRFLSEEDGGNWPSGILVCLREAAMRQAAFEVVLELDLRRLLDAFSEIGVFPLLLKGTPLSHILYPEPGLRPRCDTDLLIPDSARKKTVALMERLGYQGLHEAEVDYINAQMSYSKRVAQGVFCSYDIHWQVSNCNRQFSRDFVDGRLFEDSQAIPALGEHARTLSKVDALIFSCFHRAGHFAHHGDRLIWLYDMHLFCQALSEQEAKVFSDRTKKLNIVTVCADAFVATRFWFKTEPPPALEALFLEGGKQESSALLLRTGRLDGIKQHALLELQGLSTWLERLNFLLQNAFPPTEYMLWRYNRKNKRALPWLYLKRCAEGVYIFLRK
ncbi:MAG: hypothetical protein D3924_14805 [Candidatus Electrothrix sp. AR4]|nr:hypothetical protein [Candidatus Electrothrix sp. AR4]